MTPKTAMQTTKFSYCIALSGGGTGGHVYPALAMLQRLHEIMIAEQPQATLEVLWLGGHSGIEKTIIQQYQDSLSNTGLSLQFCGISCGKLRRYFSWQNFSDLFRIALGTLQSYRILYRRRPSLLFSKGGFVTVPSIVAAKLLNIPILAHESDLDPGLATRLVLPLVETLFLPYEQSRQYYKTKYQNKLQVSGNPVRTEFFASEPNAIPKPNPRSNPAQILTQNQVLPQHWLNTENQLQHPLLLILGGSLGAHELNSYLKYWLQSNHTGFLNQLYILHQCGEPDYHELKTLESQHRNYRVLPFIPLGLGAAYHLCRSSGGLVVSRAGAGSLWEIQASRNCAILVPLRSGSRGDQLRNAKLFAEQGWAHCFIPSDIANQGTQEIDYKRNSQKLLEQIRIILQDGEPADLKMSRQIPDAAQCIAEKIWQYLEETKV